MCPLDRAGGLDQIAAAAWPRHRRSRRRIARMEKPVETSRRRRIIWVHVLTVLSAAILISAEVFGAAFAGGWALAGLFHLGDYGGYVLQLIFLLIGLFIMASFVRAASKV